MHLVSHIGLIRLINQSHPHPPIRFFFARAIFMKWVAEDRESIFDHRLTTFRHALLTIRSQRSVLWG